MIRLLNAFPLKSGCSQTYTPRNIIDDLPHIDCNDPYLPFGSYAMVYERTTNTQRTRAVPGIALSPIDNMQGDQWFMSLDSGRKIHGMKWVEEPISEEFIERVEKLRKKENMPRLKKKCAFFQYKNGEPVIDEVDGELWGDYDEDYAADQEPVLNLELDEEDDDESYHSYVDNQHDIGLNYVDPIDNEEINDLINEQNDQVTANNNDDDNAEHNNNDNIENNMLVTDDDEETSNVDDSSMDEADSESDDNVDDNDSTINENSGANKNSGANTSSGANANSGANAPRRSTRSNFGKRQVLDVDPSRKSYYSEEHKMFFMQSTRGKILPMPLHAQFMMMRSKILDITSSKEDLYRIAVSVCFTMLSQPKESEVTAASASNVGLGGPQMSAKQGIKMYGQRAIAAMFKEYKQLVYGPHGQPVIAPIDYNELTSEQRKRALETVNLIKEKRTGDIKGRACANGSRQRRYLKEDESVASPTVGIESLMLTLIIAAYEQREVAVFDVPGAFLHSDIPDNELLLMVIRDEFVDILCEVCPDYIPHVQTLRNGRKVLYVKVLKAIYGCIQSALLWYQLYTDTLKNMGFTLNEYDRCIANKVIDGSQCTIAFHVDDNIISHKSRTVRDDVLKQIGLRFGELTIQRAEDGPVDFLGMMISFDKDKKLASIDMSTKIKGIINMVKDLPKYATTPAKKDLFDIDIDPEPLSPEESDLFHSVVSALLFVCVRCRLDIEPTIAFLCTRVRASTRGDMNKLKRCLRYLELTIDDKRYIGARNLTELFTWIDASHLVHANMRGVTGGVTSMGHGVVHGRAAKQKMNSRSSCETELIGVYEYLPYNIWFCHFMKAQGYEIQNNVLYQDNQSAIKIEKNGRNSCTGNSRHIAARYYWVKDMVDKGLVKIQYCPTELMLADFFTKPLQGNLFNIMSSYVMGKISLHDLIEQIKERVGRLKKDTVQEDKDTVHTNVQNLPVTNDDVVSDDEHNTVQDNVQSRVRTYKEVLQSEVNNTVQSEVSNTTVKSNKIMFPLFCDLNRRINKVK